MHTLPRALLTWFLLLIFLAMVLYVHFWAAAMGWPYRARLFPLTVGIVGVILMVVELVTTYMHVGQASSEGVTDLGLDTDLPPRVVWGQAAVMLGLLVMLVVGIITVGFHVAAATFTFLYLRLKAGSSWLHAFLVTAGVWVFFFVILDRLLNIPMIEPMIRF